MSDVNDSTPAARWTPPNGTIVDPMAAHFDGRHGFAKAFLIVLVSADLLPLFYNSTGTALISILAWLTTLLVVGVFVLVKLVKFFAR